MSKVNSCSTLLELLRWRAQRQPDRLAYTFLPQGGGVEGAELTYGELDRQARAFGARLQQLGAQGERALLLYSTGPEFWIAFMGCIYAGAIAIPIPPPRPARPQRALPRIRSVVRDAEASLVLATAGVLPLVEALAAQIPDLRRMHLLATEETDVGLARSWHEPEIDRETLAYLQYTSGSTASPKGVMVSHANALDMCANNERLWHYTPDSIAVNWLPYFHDYGMFEGYLQPLCSGFPVYVMAPLAFIKQPVRWLNVISHHRATHASAPPFAFDHCARAIPPEERSHLDLSSWRMASIGAEVIHRETLERFVEVFGPCGFRRATFHPIYGLAEATLMLTTKLASEMPMKDLAVDAAALEKGRVVAASAGQEGVRRVVSCGGPAPGVELAIVDPETRRRVSADAVGEVWAATPMASKGYWQRPRVTAETFAAQLAETGDGPFLRTGDLGFLRDGELYVTGRLKELIIIRGSNYFPRDIELTVEQSHPLLRFNFCAAFPVEVDNEERLVVAVEVESGYRSSDHDDVIGAVRQAVSEVHDLQVYAVELLRRNSLPKTSSGKIQRRACAKGFLEGTLELVAAPSAVRSAPPVAPAIASGSPEALREWLISQLAERLRVEPEAIDPRQPFARYGLDSTTAVSMAGRLGDLVGRSLPDTTLYQYPSVDRLVRYLTAGEAAPGTVVEGLADRGPTRPDEPIAIIGIGCRFPGAPDPEAFWHEVREGVDAVRQVPPERWDLETLYDPDPSAPGKLSTRWAGLLDGVDLFDASFFGISPREAVQMDPQQRLIMEVGWQALENAGQVVEELAGSRTGVFVGATLLDYVQSQLADSLSAIDVYTSTGNSMSILSNRLSYQFDFKGPSITVDTACSSSLVAILLACRSLRDQECDLALAGGVNVLLWPGHTICFSKARLMAPDGRCKTFDARADGYVRGEGAGMVALKPLSRALADGDRIYALIRGGAVAQDGRTNGLTAPSGKAQELMLREAYRRAGLSPGQVQYVEAHGTGTDLGDQMEAQALGAVFAEGRPAGSRCIVGSVKTNIGHVEAAAGVAGLIKTVLALRHREIPPSLHFREPNPKIPFDRLPLRVQQHLEPWPGNGVPRCAGVSSFGFGGTIAHLVVEEASAGAEHPPALAERPTGLKERAAADELLLPISAKSAPALRSLARSYHDFLASDDPAVDLGDVCHTAGRRRSHHQHRLAVAGSSRQQMVEGLAEWLAREEGGDREPAAEAVGRRPKLAFVFTGQGPQWLGMGRELMARERRFRETFEECDRLLRRHGDVSLLEEMAADEEHSRLTEPAVAQPAFFALQIALAALWRSWGLEPDVVVGQSVGEVAAAHVAGALDLEQAIRVIFHRGRLLQRLIGQGKMALVALSEEDAGARLQGYEDRLSIAAVNGPTSSVLSGEPAALDELLQKLTAEEIFCRPLAGVTFAAHCPQVASVEEEMVASLAGLAPHRAALPLVSTVTGEISDGLGCDAGYWSRNMRQPVRFTAALDRLLEEGCEVFLEHSPHPLLTASVDEYLRHRGRRGRVLPSLHREQGERSALLASLGTLYGLGCTPSWSQVNPPGRCVTLPSYPWQKERFWLEPAAQSGARPRRLGAGGAVATRAAPLLTRHWDSARSPGESFWQLELGDGSPAYLDDHRVEDAVVVPAAFYVEVVAEAAQQAFGAGPCVLGEVELRQALLLGEEGSRTVQLAWTGNGDSRASFQIYSRPAAAGEEAWVEHVVGEVHTSPAAAEAAAAETPTAIRARCREELDGADVYRALAAEGLCYGPSFQGIERLWRGDGEALGELRIPGSLVAEVGAYRLHPALLDACFQVLAVAGNGDGGGPYLPVALAEMRILDPPGTHAWSHVEVRPPVPGDGGDLRADVELLDDSGRVLAAARGLRARRLDRRAAATDFEDWLYVLRWQAASRPAGAATPASAAGLWLVFSDRGGQGETLGTLLEECAQRVVRVAAGDAYEATGPDRYRLDPNRPEDFRRLVADVVGADGSSPRGVAHLWSLDVGASEDVTLESLAAAETLGCASVLHLIQALAAESWSASPRLWLVTRGAQATDSESGPVAVAQAPLWGLRRSLAQEHPELRATCVDLGLESAADELPSLLGELLGSEREDEIAFRGGERLVSRLTRCSPGSAPVRRIQVAAGEDPMRLEIDQPGVLDRLTLRASPRHAPRRGEIEIRVGAAGLNFKDVLMALGLAPDTPGPVDLGGECAGEVVAVGEGVEGWSVGDRAIALASHCFGSFATTAAELAVPRPANLSCEQAAALPVVFVTAHFALNHLGRLARGERVLIHAASGGVGLAAIQLARLAGAEIFATAGSPEKRAFLRSLGLEHVMDSRSLDFADEVMARTAGRGVDVVLNSLAGRGVAKSLAVLAPYGRFLDLSITDIYGDGRMGLAPFRNNLSYCAIQLNRMIEQRPGFVGSLLNEVVARFADGRLQPLPHRTFPISQAENAFRDMTQAGHVGKVVLTVAGEQLEVETTRELVRADGTYLITGGLGAMGLAVARWLVEQGARHLLLLGRSAPAGDAAAAVGALRGSGATVLVARADVSQARDLAGALAQADGLPPLRGVVHAAGILDDGILLELDRERLRAVMAPKVAGAWNLHTLTASCPLDFFVLFSSVAGLLGSAGQGNYAAANAFLDALAHDRRARDLPAISLDWGNWSQIGLGAPAEAALASQGILAITPERGVAAFAQLLAQAVPPQLGVVAVDWQQMRRSGSPFGRSTMVAPLIAAATTPPSAQVEATAAVPAAERGAHLQDYLSEQLSQVLRTPRSRLNVDTPLPGLGVDSLMAMELKNRILQDLGINLSVLRLLKGASLGETAEWLGEKLDAVEIVADEASATPPSSVDGAVDETAALEPVAATVVRSLAAGPPARETMVRVISDPDRRYEPFPLTDLQHAYWIGRSGAFELGRVAAHVYFEVELDQEFRDPERLAIAWRRMVNRHEMLRAVVSKDGRQQILREVPAYQIEVEDLTAMARSAAAESLAQIRERMARQVLPTDRWPLFEIRVTRLPVARDGDHPVVLHLSLDLLIADVWSLWLLMREWIDFYRSPLAAPEPLAISFRDYLAAEQAMQDTEIFRAAQSYWMERVSSLPAAPQLPLVRQPAQLTEQRFERRKHSLGAAAWRRLKERATGAGLTASGALLGAFAEVLAVWSKSPHFTLNLTLFNRLPLHPEVDSLVGDFTSINLLEVRSPLGRPFAAFAQELQEQLWQDLEYRHFSGIQVLRQLGKSEAGRGGGVMPIVFTSTLGGSGREDGARVIPLGELSWALTQTPQVWLDHQVVENGGTLLLVWDALEELFPAGLLDDMFEAYCRLVEQLADSDEVWRAVPRDVVPGRQLETRRVVNATEASAPEMLLQDMFAAQAADQPEQPAVITTRRSLSYGELRDHASRLARRLRQLPAAPDNRVAVVLEKGWEQIVAVLGVLQAGAVYVPIDSCLPKERLWQLLEDSAAAVAVTTRELGERISWPTGITCVAVDDPALEELDPAPLASSRKPEDLAYVIYTSGSTGRPKGVMITHRAAANTIADINRRFTVGPDDRVLALSALNFDLSVYDIFGILAAGGAVVMPDPDTHRDPSHWLKLVASHRVTVWNSVPALMQMFADYAAGQPGSLPLRLVMMSGDWIPLDLPERIRERIPGAELISLGGATEASIWSIFYPIGRVEPAWESVPYGKPLANQRFHVLNADLEPCPEWVPGQLFIAGRGLAEGYWRDAEKTAASFLVHPRSGERLYRTGDLGRYLPDGNIEFLGREDFQVKIHGHRIELGEVEAVLAEHPAVRSVVAAALGDPQGGRRLVAYLVPAAAAAEKLAAAAAAGEAAAPVCGAAVSDSTAVAGRVAAVGALDGGHADDILTDPIAREQFKLEQRGIRAGDGDRRFPLPGPVPDGELIDLFQERRSYRCFLSSSLSLERFGEFLGALRHLEIGGVHKYRYGSAGGLYPVQTYLWIRPGRIGDLPGGVYYYHPRDHSLVLLRKAADLDRGVHYPGNREMFDESAFSIFLVGELDAIEPMYGERSRGFCLLEAGLMCQLLETCGPASEVGLCQVGELLDPDTARSLLTLTDRQILLHSLVGGWRDLARTSVAPAARVEEALAVAAREFARRKLPEYMVPATFMVLDALPLTANGKVDRKALPKPSGLARKKTPFVAPSNDLERTIAEVWRELLGIEQLGIHDRFFDVGADSLNVVKAHRRLTEKLAREFDLLAMFGHPTVDLLARYLSRDTAEENLSYEPSRQLARRQKAGLRRQAQRMRQRRRPQP